MQLGGKLYGGCNEKRNARGILSGAIKREQRGVGDSPHWWSRAYGDVARDDTTEAIKRLDALLEYTVTHGDEEETERIREELRRLTDEV